MNHPLQAIFSSFSPFFSPFQHVNHYLFWAILLACFCVQCSAPLETADSANQAQPATIALTMVSASGSPIPPIATPKPKNLPPPPTIAFSPTPLPTATVTPTATPSPIPIPSTTPTPSVTPERDYGCDPENEYEWTDYKRYWLADEPLPTPVADPQPHLWLGKPLPPGVGRLLTNQQYPYGWDAFGLVIHNAVDIGEDLGTPLLAVADGTVVFARSDRDELHGWRCNWYGQFVTILHDEHWNGHPIYSLYGHVLNIKVAEGDRVERGDQVAELGFGGAAEAWHLHFEVRVGDNDFFSTRNPLLWLRPGKGRGVVAGRLIDLRGKPWQGVPIWAIKLEEDATQDGQAEPENDQKEEDDPERVTWTYLGDTLDIAQSDQLYAENFVFGDLEAGRYLIYTSIYDMQFSTVITVEPGKVTQAEIIVPFRAEN